jgi:hypothetical protein
VNIDDEKMKRYEQELLDILTKLESAYNSLKDGKEIPTGQRLLGIKQKLYLLFQDIKTLNENNKN